MLHIWVVIRFFKLSCRCVCCFPSSSFEREERSDTDSFLVRAIGETTSESIDELRKYAFLQVFIERTSASESYLSLFSSSLRLMPFPAWNFQSYSFSSYRGPQRQKLRSFCLLSLLSRHIPKAMATSMAATLAAAMPTAQAAPTPAAPTYEAIPPSMSKVIDIEAEIPITNVQLDGLVRKAHRICAFFC